MKNISTIILISLFPFLLTAQQSDDYVGEEHDIMKVIELETQSFFLGEYMDWSECWEHSNDIYFEWIRSNVHHFYTSWPELNRTMRPIIAENVAKKDLFYVHREDIRIYRDGELAWVSYKQDILGDKSNEQRLLRKRNGQWRIIMVTVVASDTFPVFGEQ